MKTAPKLAAKLRVKNGFYHLDCRVCHNKDQPWRAHPVPHFHASGSFEEVQAAWVLHIEEPEHVRLVSKYPRPLS